MKLALPERSSTELTQRLLDQLEKRTDHPQKNPARDLASRLGTAKVNPWTDEARGSTGSPHDKLEVLTALRSALR